ncbi:MAG: citrate synthase [Deltaproteobacteria bacterium CG_4_10_14_0_2_um_filter_43_8]|nr:MAG: citrate synthase [Deltaproteobacteria bacterium CG11_big_fil_rev_8_21_14_0_20_42_23]PJA20370.1 MAG: citrate synthase [Deltaproteobacteria bacterium CG_4_10_14_0_2_um_filter_43_8]PJC64156.1 MAG: citrate synthase [Deltaproteobacteria bacterium CG_4_9_14_0_2_um_filter_42_21]
MAEKNHPNYSPGLEGVVAGLTKISRVDPDKQVLTLRGYDATELADQASFEEVAHLLVVGHLPNKKEKENFTKDLGVGEHLNEDMIALFKAMPKETHPMDALRTGISFLAGSDEDVTNNSHDENIRKAKRLLGATPEIVATSWRVLQGKEPIEARSDLSIAANFLYTCLGEVPDPLTEKLFNASLILYAEHGFNASTFSARVIASTLSDIYGCVTGAVAALKGPLHGGANEEAMKVLLQVKDVKQAEERVLKAIATKEKLMGFGHRVYKNGDSRVPTLKKLGSQYAEAKGDTKWRDIAQVMEDVMVREKGIHPNVDFPSAWIYYQMGIPIPLYTPIFAVARMSGWCAHIIEQHDANRLLRPSCIYEGPEYKSYKGLA